MGKLQQFEIIYINRKFQQVKEFVYGYSAIVEENLFRNKNNNNIHEFIQINFIKYL
jgi:hypothetical protein